ncbi:MAG: ParB N-terminal domain-containing protein [Dehalococcoidia bacterium]|jgi:ParB-like chromosome segregation protein Spo0J
MKIVELPIKYLREAPWNANHMSEDMMARLKESIGRYDLVTNLVVRKLALCSYEVLSGNQRLKLLTEMGFTSVPCVVLKLDDSRARLLSQALNHIQGADDIGLRAELLREVLKTIPEEEVAAILPETASSLKALAGMSEETVAEYLQNWQQAQQAKLRHLQFQLTNAQLEVIEKALASVLPKAKKKGENPTVRGNALYLLCRSYLKENADD